MEKPKRRRRSKRKILSPSFGKTSQANPRSPQSNPFEPRAKKKQPISGSNLAYTSTRSRNRQLSRTARRNSRRSKPWFYPLLTYSLRLLIVGVGMGAIIGTVLARFEPTPTRASGGEVTQAKVDSTETKPKVALASLSLKQEISSLRSQLQTLLAANPGLTTGAFVVDLETGEYLDWQGSLSFSAASTIKVPILVAFFQDVDQGKIRLDEMLTMDESVKAEGSGGMQYQQVGKQYTALETAREMIVSSDNTATNMIINRLGGMEQLNQRFRTWGLQVTALLNPLPDIEGTNTTSPKELAMVMAMVSRGELISMTSRDRIISIMQDTKNKSLIPKGLGSGAIVANKTGYIGSMLGDVGLIDLLSGKRYIAAVMVARSHDDYRAKTIIREISRAAYEYFGKPQVIPGEPDMTSTPEPTSPSPLAIN